LSPEQITAVVLAGGLGTRVQHLLPGLPKPMAPVCGKPWLEWVARYLRKQGIRDVIVSSGYKHEVIAAHFASQPIDGASVTCIAEPQPLGTGGALLYAAEKCGRKPECWAVLNGDTLAFADIGQAISALNDPRISGVMYARPVPDTSRYGSLELDGQSNLRRFVEKVPGQGVVSTGVYVFRRDVLKWFPKKHPLSLEHDVFPALTSAGALIKVVQVDSPFLDIGTPESLPLAPRFIESNIGQFSLESRV
jgi:NDP-sugar pyrophosphorylase family protein